MIFLRRSAALCRKELYSAFRSPSLYMAAALFLIFSSVWFFYLNAFFVMNRAELHTYFSVFPAAFTFLIPALTMKSWAEERKSGTEDVLFSLPFSEQELVAGKFSALLVVLLFILGLSVPVYLCLLPLGKFDGGTVVSQYLGSFLLGSTAAASGLYMSARSTNQLSAFLATFILLIVLTSIHQINTVFNPPYVISVLCNYLSFSYHFESFTKGLVDTRNLAFFVLVTLLMLLMTNRTLLFRKWS